MASIKGRPSSSNQHPDYKLEDFLREAEQLFAKVVTAIVFTDTLELRLNRRFTPSETHKLMAINPGEVYLPDEFTKHYNTHPIIARFHQPSRKTFEYLFSILPDRQHYIYRHDTAVDFCTETRRDAYALHEFGDRHLIMPWRGGTRHLGHCEDTNYHAQASSTRNIASYPDKLSKKTDEFCWHVEARVMGKQTCQRYGLSHIRDVFTINLIEQLDRNARFAIVDFENCERNAQRIDLDLRKILARADLQDAVQSPQASNLYQLHAQRQFDLMRAYRKHLGVLKVVGTLCGIAKVTDADVTEVTLADVAARR